MVAIPMPSIVSAEIFYLEQMQKNGRIKNVVIPECLCRGSVVITNKENPINNDRFPTTTLGNDGIKEKIRRKGNAKGRSSWG